MGRRRNRWRSGGGVGSRRLAFRPLQSLAHQDGENSRRVYAQGFRLRDDAFTDEGREKMAKVEIFRAVRLRNPGGPGRARGMGRGGPGGKESIGVFALGSTFPRQRRERARGRLSCLSGSKLTVGAGGGGGGGAGGGGFPRYEVTKCTNSTNSDDTGGLRLLIINDLF